MEEIHWPGPGSGIVYLGVFDACHNEWRFNDGVLEVLTFMSEGFRPFKRNWQRDLNSTGLREWTDFMLDSARRLGLMEPPRPRQELVAEMRAKIMAVSQCGDLEAVRRVLT